MAEPRQQMKMEKSELMEEDHDEEEEEHLLPPPTSWFEGDLDGRGTELTSNNLSLDGPDDAVSDVDQTENQENPEDTFSLDEERGSSPPPSSSVRVGAPSKAPSWKEQATEVLPAAAKELVSTSLRRVYHTARVSYAICGRRNHKFSDIGSHGGYYRSPSQEGSLPPISSLSWVDRQLVHEWRTCHTISPKSGSNLASMEDFVLDMEEEFERARTLVPPPLPRPVWRKADHCFSCQKPFGPTMMRHHCRMCGNSFCQRHSNASHALPHFGYDPDVAERVCETCKRILEEQNLAERVAWRLARCRDYFSGDLTPYFATGLDTVEDAAYRLTRAALAISRKIPLGAQAHVAVETLEVLRKYGVKGVYTLILRKEFLAAADLLCRALGINKLVWPLSVHELSAAIFYALAQHRALRGMNPEREHIIHTLKEEQAGDSAFSDIVADDTDEWGPFVSAWTGLTAIQQFEEVEGETIVWKGENAVIDETDNYNPMAESVADLLALADTSAQTGPTEETPKQEAESKPEKKLPFNPVCEYVSDAVLSSLIFYAPIALNFIYAEQEVDMQLLAAQQGWRLLYAHLQADSDMNLTDRPASAMFLHTEKKIACMAIRGTASINDVVTDMRAMPVPFPENEDTLTGMDEGWTPVFRGQGLAFGGMARAAANLFRENIDSMVSLAKKGFRIRIIGHSLGGAVAALLGALVLRHIERLADPENAPTDEHGTLAVRAILEKKDFLRVYGYGTPSCVDHRLSDSLGTFCTTVVLHDDVVPRLNPTSIRGLLKHLLHIRETWVKAHLASDIQAIADRAKGAWAPRSRGSFTLLQSSSPSQLRGYCRKQFQNSKRKFMAIKKHVVRKTLRGKQDNRDVLPSLDEGDEMISLSSDEEIVPVAETVEVVSFDDPTTLEGLVLDGDQFFDSEESLLESDDEEEVLVSSVSTQTQNISLGDAKMPTEEDRWVAFPDDDEEEQQDSQKAPVMLEEQPLPRMFLPGKIIHLYTRRGAYHAAYVPRAFRELRRISMAGNMLKDHSSKSYYEGLLEVRSVRNASEDLPTWTGFEEEGTCSCCASKFTWASTSNSEAQEARDKHNCRSCGALVCDPCSQNRIPLPSVGITVPSRVCDRCYNDIGGFLTGSTILSESCEEELLGETKTESRKIETDVTTLPVSTRPQRQRERRSFVVDELALRVQSSVLTCS
mmetsp:Transcript_5145/g.7959  ORF Transcript_5145/g.7959 Transcript_5145/m.7959 type:complete len:1185 (+) Transcript_5145:66-3620(+)